MKNFIFPILTSILVGIFLFHYEDIFNKPDKLFVVERAKRVISLADKHISASIYSIHNETSSAVTDISIHAKTEGDIEGLSIATESDRSIISKNQVDKKDDEFTIKIPVLKSNDVIYLDIVVETAEHSAIQYKFSDMNQVIPEIRAHTLSYDTRLLMVYSAAAIFALAYVAIILSIYLRWQRTIFPGFFRDGSEGGFALLHSGAVNEAKEYILNLQNSGRGHGVYDLANLSACHAILGDPEKATKFLLAAKIRCYTPSLKIIRLNELLVSKATFMTSVEQDDELRELLEKYAPDSVFLNENSLKFGLSDNAGGI